jgi:hypothetical protein
LVKGSPLFYLLLQFVKIFEILDIFALRAYELANDVVPIAHLGPWGGNRRGICGIRGQEQTSLLGLVKDDVYNLRDLNM